MIRRSLFLPSIVTLLAASNCRAFDPREPAFYGCYEKNMEWRGGPSMGYKEAPEKQNMSNPYRIVYKDDLDDMRKHYSFSEVLIPSRAGLFHCPACKLDGSGAIDCMSDLFTKFLKEKAGAKSRKKSRIPPDASVEFLMHLKGPPPREGRGFTFNETLKIKIAHFSYSDAEYTGVGARSGDSIEVELAKKPEAYLPSMTVECQETAEPKYLDAFLMHLSRDSMSFDGNFGWEDCDKLTIEQAQKSRDPFCRENGLLRDQKFRTEYELICIEPIRRAAKTMDAKQYPHLKHILEYLDRAEKAFRVQEAKDADKAPKAGNSTDQVR